MRKNVKLFLDKPIISYSIEAAISSALFSEVMVSTDDVEIAHIAKEYGAKVPFYRSEKNSDDDATTYAVIEEVLSEYEKLNKSYDNVCCIYPCAPFITSEKLNEAFEILISESRTTVFPIVPYSNPIQRALKCDKGVVTSLFPEYSTKRSQDLHKAYFDAGQFYWISISRILKEKEIYSSNSSCVILDQLEAQDIDNESDWLIAEFKYKFLKTKQ